MFSEQTLVVHAIELVSSQHALVVGIAVGEAMQVLPDGIGGTLEPVHVPDSLLGGQNFDGSARKRIEIEAAGHVPVQRCRVELRQDKYVSQSRIDGVANRKCR